MRLLLLLAIVVCVSTPIQAAVSTDRPGAVIIFPKVASDQNQETIIQLSNAVSSRIYARCFYLNGAPDPTTGQPTWALTNFQITLTTLQPAVWVAGDGLPAVPPDRPPDLYPGPIPPVGVGFLGELACVVVNASESPQSINALTGEVTLVDRNTQSARKYPGLTVQGLPGNNGDNTLLFDDVEYDSCPRMLLLNHFFDDAPDPVLNSPIASHVTFVPCSMDLEQGIPGSATLQFEVFNEFEQRLTTSIPITCFEDIDLSDIDSKAQRSRSIFNFAQQGTLVGQTRIRPVPDANGAQGHGVLAIGEEFRDARQRGSALTLHFVDGNLQPDVFVLPSSF